MKSHSQKTAKKKSRKAEFQIEGAGSAPGYLMKERFIYMEGAITKACRGTYFVNLSNEMECLATARKMDSYLKVSLLEGDKVTVELDPLNFSQGEEKVRGRIIWRNNRK